LSVAEDEDMRKISAWGCPAVLGTMFAVCGILYRGFKRNGWLQ
jgi:hypothetical protein